jgi:hypothetical protein
MNNNDIVPGFDDEKDDSLKDPPAKGRFCSRHSDHLSDRLYRHLQLQLLPKEGVQSRRLWIYENCISMQRIKLRVLHWDWFLHGLL